MAEPTSLSPNMLLVEPVTLLRRTVSLTARTMNVARVHEAASCAQAVRLLKEQVFDGAVIAIEPGAGQAELLALLDRVRGGDSLSKAGIPIAVMLEHCDAAMLAALQARGVSRILLKPFKARNLLDTFSVFVTPLPPQAGRPLFGIAPD
ncbi:MAG TPA: response regulator [Telluria sp.]|nr:response regulator [Telluria sp.]